MTNTKIIPPAVAAIIPASQLRVTREHIEAYFPAIERLEGQINQCPKLYQTDQLKEHPAMFHYFFAGTDMYFCEYDPAEKVMFGFTILNRDIINAEWGYTSVDEMVSIAPLNIDYYFEGQTIEAAIFRKYPDYFKKPASLYR